MPSLTISRHQINMQSKILKKPKNVVCKPSEKPWKKSTLPAVNVSALNEDNNGITLGSTK